MGALLLTAGNLSLTALALLYWRRRPALPTGAKIEEYAPTRLATPADYYSAPLTSEDQLSPWEIDGWESYRIERTKEQTRRGAASYYTRFPKEIET
jgi:hypothetical protein